MRPSPPPAWIWGWAVDRLPPTPTPGASSGFTAAPRHGPCVSSLLQLLHGRLGEGGSPRGLPRSHGHECAHTRTHTGTPAYGHARPPPTYARVQTPSSLSGLWEHRGERGTRQWAPQPTQQGRGARSCLGGPWLCICATEERAGRGRSHPVATGGPLPAASAGSITPHPRYTRPWGSGLAPFHFALRKRGAATH